MQTRSRDIFATIRTEGALLPADLLQRIGEGDGDLEGLKPGDYHLVEGEKLNEAISRSWNRLLAVWNSFRAAVDKLPEKELGTTLTREKWLLPLFQELGYGRLPTSKAVVIEGKSYPISHFWQPAPIHLIGCRVDIDRRTAGVAGAARISPHGLVQEFLNRSEPHLWAFVSNGLGLRILRDNVSLTRQAFVEFDLAGMMDGEVYSDFILLWLLCHQSRVEVPEDKSPENCWLEKWSQAAQQRGTRALDQLRNGVEEAIKALGSGFLSHLANTTLKEKLKNGALDKQEYYRQLLRTVYRLIFIFASEDRGLLLDPQADQQAKDCYMQYYSATRLRKLAQRKRGTRHCDLWRGLSLVFDKLGSNEGCPELALPPLGSYLWSREAIADLDGCDISNRDFLEAVRALAFTVDNNVLRAVDYKNLGSEELGSVYESLLELHPELNVDVGTFELSQVAGSERKTTGSYYTHTSLVNCLLDSALEPVLDEAVKKDDPEQTILNLKVCDPATGSGHFLVAAAHRMAKRLAAIRTGDDEPSPEATRMALRDVIGHCIYGVDMNPMAVELCKVSLWLEALEPGKPLSFLDHHIKCGNSLLGTTPALLEKGIPDDAFKPIEGDDKKLCNVYKKQNKEERKGQRRMLFTEEAVRPWDRLGNLAAAVAELDQLPDDDLASIQKKQQKYAELVRSSGYKYGHLLADTWCAAFVWKKTKDFDYPITEQIFREIEKNPHNIAPWMVKEILRLAREYQFFHWHLEFPDVFRIPAEDEVPENEQTGWSGGFDCILGNPPWEKLKLMEVEFFASLEPTIAKATTQAVRRKAISKLSETNPAVYEKWKRAVHKIEHQNNLIRNSRFYKYTAVGELNTYALFTELFVNTIKRKGRCGLITKSSLATGVTYGSFFGFLLTRHLVSLYDFKNWALYFPTVGFHERYSLVTLKGSKQGEDSIDFGFQLIHVEDLREGTNLYSLNEKEFQLFSPNTGVCPLFTHPHQKTLAEKVYKQFPVLVNEKNGLNSWRVKYIRLLDMSGDSNLFVDLSYFDENNVDKSTCILNKNQHRYFPLYEGKYIQQFDYRFATYGGIPAKNRYTRKAATLSPTVDNKNNPYYEIEPRYWVKEIDFRSAIEQQASKRQYYVVARLVTNVISNARSVIACIMPERPCNNLALILDIEAESSFEYAKKSLLFTSLLCSFPFDFIARIKMSENLLKSTLWEIAAPSPDNFEKNEFVKNGNYVSFCLPRSLELSYTTWLLQPLAKDLDMNIPPFVWNEERRFKIRRELDAAFFHLYSINRDDIGYILDTFPIVKRRDEEKYSSYRTKELILDIYDKMAEAIKTGQPYQTILDPPPADPSVAHPPIDSATPTVTEKINPIYTIGHSNTSVDKLISLLKQNKIQVLADVRSVPYSRHVPQANREAIERAVKAAGIKYLFMGEQLGGRPKDIKIKDEHGNLDYSKLASTERFQEGMDRLLKGASQYSVCLMCSEEDPSRCHRSLLISKELDKLGVKIRHIRRDGHIETQGELEKQIPPAQEGLFSEK